MKRYLLPSTILFLAFAPTVVSRNIGEFKKSEIRRLFVIFCILISISSFSSLQAQSITYSSPIDLTDTTNVTFDGSPYDFSGQTLSGTGISFNPDGSKMYVVEASEINQYSLTTPFDITTGVTFDGSPLNTTTEGNNAGGVAFNQNGTKMFVVFGAATSEVNQYSLTTPYDITSGVTFDGSPFDLSGEETDPRGFAFSVDGTKMFIIGIGGLEVNQYSLATPFIITSGVTFDGSPFSVSSETSGPVDVKFNADGTKMFVMGVLTDEIMQYSLTAPFEITTGGVTFDGSPLNVGTEEPNALGIAFNSTGTKMYNVGSGDAEVNQYSLNTNVFKEAAANDGSVEGSLVIIIVGDTFTSAGGTLTSGSDYTVDNMPAGLTPNLAVATNGFTATLTLSGNATNHEDADDVNDLQFTFQDAAFTGGNASAVTNAIGASSGLGIDFTVNPLNTETDILQFTFPEETGAAPINAVNHTVVIEVAGGTDLSSLTPTITLSPDATVSPLSGVVQDFTNPVVYTVTAEDGVTMQSWVVTVTLQVTPSIQGFSLDPSNNFVDIFFSEGMYGDPGGTTAVDVSEFLLTFSQNGGNANSVDIPQITDNADNPLVGGESTIRVYLDVNPPASGEETIEIQPIDGNSIFNASGVALPAIETTGAFNLNPSGPAITGVGIDLTNDFVDIDFSEGLWGDAGASTPVQTSDFQLDFQQNGGTTTSVDIPQITDNTNAPLIGGESTIRVHLDVNPEPSGPETIEIQPTDGNSIFNGAGVALPAFETTLPINLIVPKDYFWVGDAGSWDDLAHWATTSGGSTFHTTVPTIVDDVYFDGNSFTQSGQIVFVPDDDDARGASFRTMDWRGVTNTPTFQIKRVTSPWLGSRSLGSLYFDDNMILDFDGAEFYLYGDNYVIDTRGHYMGLGSFIAINFHPLGGEVDGNNAILASDLNCTHVYINGGSFNTSNYNISAPVYFWITQDNQQNVELGSSNISTNLWRATNLPAGSVLGAGSATIHMTGSFRGGGNYYNEVIFNEGVNNIRDDNNFGTLTFLPGAEVRLEAGSTQSTDNLVVTGTSDKIITIKSMVEGEQANLVQNGGTVIGDWLSIMDNNASGATFIASNSVDNGNVTGWNLNIPQISGPIEPSHPIILNNDIPGPDDPGLAWFTVNFDKSMNTDQFPDLNFPNEQPWNTLEGPINTEWFSDTQVVFYYNVWDVDEEIFDIDIEIANAVDTEGSWMNPTVQNDIFSIDTNEPRGTFSHDDADGFITEGQSILLILDLDEPIVDAPLQISFSAPSLLGTVTATEVSPTQYTYNYTGENVDGLVQVSLVNGVDASGNEIEVTDNTILGNYSFGIDNANPTVVLTDDHDDDIVSDVDVVVIKATFDDVSGPGSPPKISIDNGDVTNADMSPTSNRLVWTYRWIVPDSQNSVDGPATVTVTATDLVGNPSEPATGMVAYIIDNSPESPDPGPDISGCPDFLWTSNDEGITNFGLGAIAKDSQGFIYSSWSYSGTINVGANNLQAFNRDLLITKYSSAGEVIWYKSFPGWVENDTPMEVRDGFLYTVFSFNQIDFLDGTGFVNNGAIVEATGIIKMDLNGNVIFAKHYNGRNYVEDAGVDSQGNIYLTSRFYEFIVGTDTIGGHDFSTIKTSLIKFDQSGDYLWGKFSNTNNSPFYGRLQIDALDNPWIFNRLTEEVIFDNNTLTVEGSLSEKFVAKFDPAGNNLFIRSLGQSVTNAFEVDKGGNLYFATFPENEGVELGIFRMNPSGAIDWVFPYSAPVGQGFWSYEINLNEDETELIVTSWAVGDEFVFDGVDIASANNIPFVVGLDPNSGEKIFWRRTYHDASKYTELHGSITNGSMLYTLNRNSPFIVAQTIGEDFNPGTLEIELAGPSVVWGSDTTYLQLKVGQTIPAGSIIQWYQNDFAISGKTGTQYLLVGINQGTSANYSARLIRSNGCTTSSNSVSIETRVENDPFSDRFYVEELFNQYNGPAWTNSDNWFTPNLEDWYGITTNAEGFVTEIDLSNNNLNFPGGVSVDLGQMRYLEKLDVSGNRFDQGASLIFSFSKFTTLDYADFSDMEVWWEIFNVPSIMDPAMSYLDLSNTFTILPTLYWVKDFENLVYYPQKDTVQHVYYKENQGEDLTLQDQNFGRNGNGIVYRWFKDGIEVGDKSILDLTDIGPDNIGIYYEVITHPDFPLLTYHTYHHVNDFAPATISIPENKIWTAEVMGIDLPDNQGYWFGDNPDTDVTITKVDDNHYRVDNYWVKWDLFIDGDSIIAKDRDWWENAQTHEPFGFGKGYINNDVLYIPWFSYQANKYGDTTRFTMSGDAGLPGSFTSISIDDGVNEKVLKWRHDLINVSWFDVEYSLEGGAFSLYEEVQKAGTSYSLELTALVNESNYEFRVIANGYGGDITSSIVALTTKTTQTTQIDPIQDEELNFQLIDLSGSASSGLPVSFSVYSGKARIENGNQLQKVGAGKVVVQANQPGNDTFLTAVPDTTSFEIFKGPQSITFDSIPARTYFDQKFKLNATGGPSPQPITYTVTSGDAVTVVGDSVYINGTGEIMITASLVGDIDYNPAENVTQPLCISAGSPEIVANGETSFCQGSVELEAIDIPGVNYKWQLNGIDIDTATSTTYAATAFGLYSLKLDTDCSTSFSLNSIELFSSDAPIAVLIAAVGQTSICQGDSVKLFVVPEDSIEYQWYQNDSIVGENIPEFYAKEDGNYTLALTNSCGTSFSSNSFVIDVLETPESPEIMLSSAPHVCEGESMVLSIDFFEDVKYEWFRNGTKIPFEFGNALQVFDSGAYHVEMFNLCTRVGSQDTVRIGVAPKAPSAQTIQVTGLLKYCAGDSTLLSLETIAAGMNYAWYRDDTILVEQDTTAYYASEAGTYHVEIINACRAVRSTNDVFLDVISPPQIRAITTNRNPVLCEGDSITLIIPLEPRVEYTWYKDDSLVDTGANRITVNAAGEYRVEMANQCGVAASANSFEVEVIFPLDIPPINAATQTICVGDVLALETDSLKYADYRWYFNGTLLTDNANVLMVQDTGSYQVEVENLCYKSGISESFKLRFHPLPVKPDISLFVNDDCTNREYKLTAEGGYSAYQWIFESATLIGAVQPEYDVLLNGFYTVGAWDTNGCYIESDPLEVIIKQIPRPAITSQGDPDSLLSTVPAEEYQWFVNNMYIVGASKRDLEVLYNGIYKVSVVYTDGCIGFSNNFQVDNEEYDDFRSVAIYTSDTSLVLPKRHEIDFNLVMVYPNPAHSRVTIVYDGSLAPDTKCRIFDLNGKMVREQIMTRYGGRIEAEIDVKGLTTGVYLVLIENKYKPVYQKLVIQAQ